MGYEPTEEKTPLERIERRSYTRMIQRLEWVTTSNKLNANMHLLRYLRNSGIIKWREANEQEETLEPRERI